MNDAVAGGLEFALVLRPVPPQPAQARVWLMPRLRTARRAACVGDWRLPPAAEVRRWARPFPASSPLIVPEGALA